MISFSSKSVRAAFGFFALTACASATLQDGLAAYYSFETNLQDQSGNGRHLTSFGTPEAAWAGGTVTRSGASSVRDSLLAGKALNLVNADADYVRAPLGSGPSVGSGVTNLGGNFTIAAWQYLAPLSTSTGRFFVFEAANNYDVSWGTVTANTGNDFVPYNSQSAGSAVDLSRGAWHHVVHVFETSGSSVLLTVYVDGVSVGAVVASSSALDFSGINIGNARDGQTRRWDGLLDEIAVWNRALGETEITELRTRGLNGYGVNQNLALAGKAYVDLSSAQPLHGAVPGTGLYDLNQQIPVQAVPGLGYKFTGWTGTFSGQPASFTHTLTGDVHATAQFAKDLEDPDLDGLSNYDELVIHGTNPGLADSDGDGIPDATEINVTRTNPIQSDTGMLARADSVFGLSGTGAIALTPLRLIADSGGGDRSLVFGLLASADRSNWSAVALDGQAVTILPGGNLQLAFPAPSSVVSIYDIVGSKP